MPQAPEARQQVSPLQNQPRCGQSATRLMELWEKEKKEPNTDLPKARAQPKAERAKKIREGKRKSTSRLSLSPPEGWAVKDTVSGRSTKLDS